MDESTADVGRMPMRMRGAPRRSQEQTSEFLNKRLQFGAEATEQNYQFEACDTESRPLKVPPHSPSSYYLHPHHGGHALHLPAGYAFGLVEISTSNTISQTGTRKFFIMQSNLETQIYRIEIVLETPCGVQ